ncbi:hypothetical protein [Streptomyces sp. NPDC008139]|uniref:hypothetical protein n=1 Tax=Streptomyces sp. NPDC008139 TaxID=3364814 RepID=UPI0036EEF278
MKDKAPKSAAGVRPVAFPAELLPDVLSHLEHFTGMGQEVHVFQGPKGGLLRRSNFRDDWMAARDAAGIPDDVHLP